MAKISPEARLKMQADDAIDYVVHSCNSDPTGPNVPDREIFWIGKCRHSTYLGIDIQNRGHVTSTFIDPLKFPFNEPCARLIYRDFANISYDDYPVDPELDVKLKDGRLTQEDLDRLEKARLDDTSF